MIAENVEEAAGGRSEVARKHRETATVGALVRHVDPCSPMSVRDRTYVKATPQPTVNPVAICLMETTRPRTDPETDPSWNDIPLL